MSVEELRHNLQKEITSKIDDALFSDDMLRQFQPDPNNCSLTEAEAFISTYKSVVTLHTLMSFYNSQFPEDTTYQQKGKNLNTCLETWTRSMVEKYSSE